MLATFLSTPNFPSDLKRAVIRAAMEIGFVCDSNPFWTQIGDVLKERESDQMSEKQRADAAKIAEEERAKRELETHELRMQVGEVESKLDGANRTIERKDGELEKARLERVELMAKVDALGKQFALAQTQQRDLLAQAERQQVLLKEHIASLQQMLVASQQETAQARARAEELTQEQVSVQELHEYMVAVAKFCNVKPPKARRGGGAAGAAPGN